MQISCRPPTALTRDDDVALLPLLCLSLSLSISLARLPLRPEKILAAVVTGFRDSFLVQMAIKAAVVGTHVHRDRLERWQVCKAEKNSLVPRGVTGVRNGRRK